MAEWPITVTSGNPFTLDNIPFGIFTTSTQNEKRAGVAVGDYVIDLSVLEQDGWLDTCLAKPHEKDSGTTVFKHSSLNAFAELPANCRTQVRQTLIDWLNDKQSPLFSNADLNGAAIVPIEQVTMHLPFDISGFADFMCADVHVENCSRIAKAQAPVPPCFYSMPLAYNGRASSVIVSGEPVHRPRGMIRTSMERPEYSFLPSAKMDYEVEMGVFISKPVPFGQTITAETAEDHIFGFVLLNDWSARDIQFAEMMPLGPFNGKSSGTSITPWVVTLDAMKKARCASTVTHPPKGHPALAPHLQQQAAECTWDIELKVSVNRISSGVGDCIQLSKSNLRDVRWSPAQMVAHQASSGGGLRTGDLIGTGTISSPNDGPSQRTLGCLLELTNDGSTPVKAQSGQELTWLEDNDEVIITGRLGGQSVGFGTLKSKLVASRQLEP